MLSLRFFNKRTQSSDFRLFFDQNSQRVDCRQDIDDFGRGGDVGGSKSCPTFVLGFFNASTLPDCWLLLRLCLSRATFQNQSYYHWVAILIVILDFPLYISELCAKLWRKKFDFFATSYQTWSVLYWFELLQKTGFQWPLRQACSSHHHMVICLDLFLICQAQQKFQKSSKKGSKKSFKKVPKKF